MSCTLGEVKNRADLLIYWGGNPAECHPRHFTRYTLTHPYLIPAKALAEIRGWLLARRMLE